MSRRIPAPTPEEIHERGERFVAEFTKGGNAPREAGQKLAWQLRSAAIGLASDKATEFSPEIEKLTLLAAKVACLAFEPKAPELVGTFERDVDYYAGLRPPSWIVGAYRAFKKSVG